MGTRHLAVGCSVVLAVSVAIVAWRSPIDPAAWRPDSPGDMTLEQTSADLRAMQLLGEEDLKGPEDSAVDDRGRVYVGTEEGAVWQISRTSLPQLQPIARTEGRPLGLDVDATGTLWVADSLRGLLSVAPDGAVSVQASEADGMPIRFADDVEAAASGRVYFSDASSRFGKDQLDFEALEARPYGRLIVFDPATSQARSILEGLYFANGVTLAADESFVLVCETFRYRIRRLWLAGERTGESEVFADNLPGFPDGLSRSPRGTFWVALFTIRDSLLDRWLHPHRWLKRCVAGLPSPFRPGPRPYGLVLELDSEGRILRSLHDPGGSRLPNITSAEESDGFLYLGSLEGRGLGRFRL